MNAAKTLWIVETTATIGAAQAITSVSNGWSQAGRYGTEYAIGDKTTALDIARQLRAAGHKARVVR